MNIRIGVLWAISAAVMNGDFAPPLKRPRECIVGEFTGRMFRSSVLDPYFCAGLFHESRSS